MAQNKEFNELAIAVFSGNANLPLAHEITRHLHVPLGRAQVGRFSDGEVNAELMDNVRGRDVFILQTTCPPAENLMELLMMTDACKRASATRVTAVIPYFGYARQDRRPRATRVAIGAKLVANMIVSAGVDRVLTVDLHADQIQGFFDIPVDNVYASPVLLGDAWKQKYQNMIVVSPDVGGVVRARALAKRLDDADLAIIDKRRPRPNESKVMNIIGEVEGKICVLIDDLVDTAGTLAHAAQALKDEGAVKVVAYITHAVLSGAAIDRISKSVLDELVVTDTIPLTDAGKACTKIRQLSVSGLLAETIRRISDQESVSSLYID
jgi:ribose-phosphate pyrophosphokinase